MIARFEPSPADIALMRAWESAFVPVFNTLKRCVGFTLLPVVVPEAGVARALGAALEARGLRTTMFAPTSDADWEAFALHLLDASQSDAVTMLVTTGTSDVQRRGLWLINRQREAYLRTHERPLLWCVDADALRACSEEAPDFWSIHATAKFIRPPEAEAPAVVQDGRSLDALLARIDDGACDDPAVWSALSLACEARAQLDDAAYCAESAAFFSDGDAKLVALDRASRLRVGLASEAEDIERVRAFAESPTDRAIEGALALDSLTGPAARAVAAILAREGYAGRVSASLLSGQRREAWLAEARVGHRARANAIGWNALPPVFAMRPSATPSEWLRLRFEREREEQRQLVERLRALLPAIDPSEPETIHRWEPHFIAALFDGACARLGVPTLERDRAAVARLTDDERDRGSPNALLLSLLQARSEFDRHERGDWPRRLGAIIESSQVDRQVRDRAMLFAKRSPLLSSTPTQDIRPGWQHHREEQQLELFLQTPSSAAERTRALVANKMFDHERADAIERVVDALLRAGDRAVIDAGIRSLLTAVECIAILGHRAPALGAIARLVNEPSQVEALRALLRATERVAAAQDSTWSLRDLLVAIRPMITAARAIGADDELPSFSQQLRSSLQSKLKNLSRDGLRIHARLALADEPRSSARMAERLSTVWSRSTQPPLDHNGRYDVAAEVLDVARALTLEHRETIIAQLLSEDARFDDIFTTRRDYRAHAMLVVEGVLGAATAPTPAMEHYVARSARTSAAFLDARR